MAMMIRWWLCAALLFSPSIEAQDSLPAIPDPIALESNWWGYFEPTETINKTQLDVRIENSRARIEKRLQETNAEQRTTLAPLAEKIFDGLNKFSSLRDAPISNTASLSPPAENYTLAVVEGGGREN